MSLAVCLKRLSHADQNVFFSWSFVPPLVSPFIVDDSELEYFKVDIKDDLQKAECIDAHIDDVWLAFFDASRCKGVVIGYTLPRVKG